MTTETETRNKSQATVLAKITALIYECVREAGPAGIPSGHLYAMVLGRIPLEVYELCIKMLVRVGKITNKGHLLQVKEVK